MLAVVDAFVCTVPLEFGERLGASTVLVCCDGLELYMWLMIGAQIGSGSQVFQVAWAAAGG